ncbi:MAG: hypothetical protein AYK19_21460 [Theionarchaea archaeon DG-70-1]|nr:MAG: hypothetical protein AYK19_21460 [Theionarchaea archaeon DG-70-1]
MTLILVTGKDGLLTLKQQQNLKLLEAACASRMRLPPHHYWVGYRYWGRLIFDKSGNKLWSKVVSSVCIRELARKQVPLWFRTQVLELLHSSR